MGSTLKLAESYALLNRTIQHRWFKNLLSRVDIRPGFHCLDIGCGTGINTAHLARTVGPGGSVTGVDPDSYRIKVAREDQSCDNVNYVVAKSTCLPPREGGYDLVVTNAVMHWVNYEETVQTYEKVSKLLKKGGVMAVCEGAALMAEVAAFLPALTEEQRKAYCWHFLSLEENENIFKEVGELEILKMENVVDRHQFESLDDLLDWSTASVSGPDVDFKKIYEENKDIVGLLSNHSGNMSFELNYMVVRKM